MLRFHEQNIIIVGVKRFFIPVLFNLRDVKSVIVFHVLRWAIPKVKQLIFTWRKPDSWLWDNVADVIVYIFPRKLRFNQ